MTKRSSEFVRDKMYNFGVKS